ncbi:MAG: exonuclease SbcCD subunit D [Thermoflexales bacterium]|nr:exonuclease SbcCD subunit D [Thermoflexales bacterium]MDW8352113.1 exonuclease SbcCD subunit D [Anaerolineae bacterium]
MSQREPIRILHFADLHIGTENYGRIDPETGLNQRVLDFVSRLKEVVDCAIEREADVVIFAGDAFKTRDPNVTYQRAFARQIMRLSRANIATVLLVGNHDMPIMEQRATSMDIFATLDVPNVIVGREEKLHRIETKHGTVQIATVPWPQRNRLLKYEEHRGMTVEQLDQELERILDDELGRLAGEVDPGSPAILTGHFTIAGAVFGSERSVMLGRDTVIKLSSLHLEAWDYVAMGHVHKHQDVHQGRYPGVVYSGSLERIDFGEEHEPKGICWVEARRGETQWRFEPLAGVRRFVSIYADATRDGEHPTDAVLREIARHDVKHAVVRVHVKLLQHQEAMLRTRAIEEALEGAHLIAGITRDVQRDVRSRIGIRNPETLSPQALLERYFLSKNTPHEHITELMRAASEIMDAKDGQAT